MSKSRNMCSLSPDLEVQKPLLSSGGQGLQVCRGRDGCSPKAYAGETNLVTGKRLRLQKRTCQCLDQTGMEPWFLSGGMRQGSRRGGGGGGDLLPHHPHSSSDTSMLTSISLFERGS